MTTASTNQWRVTGVKATVPTPGSPRGGCLNVSPFSPPVTSVQVKMIT